MLQPRYKKKLDDLLSACRRNLLTPNEEMITRAFEFSLKAHRSYLRASGEPYFDHPFAVAMVVANEIALDDVTVTCALLHDVAEDTDFSIKDIQQEFGETVAGIVDGVTKITDIFRSHEITQAENYRKMLLSMVDDVRVMIVKFADRLHNMRTLEFLPAEKQLRLARETLEIYAPFAHRFGLAKIKWELEDLAFKILHRKEYDEIAHALKSKRNEREEYIDLFRKPIEVRLREEHLTFSIEGRPKHLYSIYNKMMKRSKPFDEIYDMFAVRIILDTEQDNDCFTVYGIVSEVYKPIPERFKNYISLPKKNGYRSIHTTVLGPDGKMVEVQIRTQKMHEVAERGVAAHWMYKEDIATIDKELENWVNWVREIFEQKNEEAPKELMESFRLNLYQDEIYVFTPKGDLKILPKGATPVDFGFEIHSDVGFHTIGAKVNGRIVPLNTALHSGDQVEILTSKKQSPNSDWEKFVVTHKAKQHIRHWIKEEERKRFNQGKEMWEKKIKKGKLHINDDELVAFVHNQKLNNVQEFYFGLADGSIDVDEVVNHLTDGIKRPEAETPALDSPSLFSKFVKSARSMASGITIFGTSDNFMHDYAKCCNPIPGDDIVGFITTGEGIKIHRRNCRNIIALRANDAARVVDVSWPAAQDADFISGIRVSGQDRTGLLNDLTQAISSYDNTNIRSINISTKDTLFEGHLILFVKNIEHLNIIVDRLRRIKGVIKVERFEE